MLVRKFRYLTNLFKGHLHKIWPMYQNRWFLLMFFWISVITASQNRIIYIEPIDLFFIGLYIYIYIIIGEWHFWQKAFTFTKSMNRSVWFISLWRVEVSPQSKTNRCKTGSKSPALCHTQKHRMPRIIYGHQSS